jgi:Helix-turn-helix domain
MPKGYAQLSLEDRCEIARLQAEGRSVRQIAATLDRAPSTIARELKRNRGSQVGYKPSYANQQARARRWSGSRLEREAGLRQAVIERLAAGWSPEQVSGRLKLEANQPIISHESIYRFIHAQIARTKDYSWRRLLPRGKSKRGFRGRRGGSPASFIDGRVSIAERPVEASDRNTPGHWEADLMLFAKYGQAILTPARAPLSPHLCDTFAQQSFRSDRRAPGQLLCQPAALAPANRHLRQRHRVCPPSRASPPRPGNLLLRSARPLAERRHRKRHRPHAPLHPPQDRPRHAAARALPRPRQRLQQHTAKMP